MSKYPVFTVIDGHNEEIVIVIGEVIKFKYIGFSPIITDKGGQYKIKRDWDIMVVQSLKFVWGINVEQPGVPS